MIRAYFILIAILVAAPATAETRYIADRVLADLYAGPTGLDLLGGLPTGTPVEVLASQSGRVRVKAADGRGGWVAEELVQAERPAQFLVLTLAEQQKRAAAELLRVQSELAALRHEQENRNEGADWWQLAAISFAFGGGFFLGVIWLDRRNRVRHGGFRV